MYIPFAAFPNCKGGTWRSDKKNGGGILLVNHLQMTVNYNFALGRTAEYEYTIDNIVHSARAKTNGWQIALAYYF